jgi:DNA-binding transcriptional LysR family regulator
VASSSDYRVTLGLVAAGIGVSLVPRMAAAGASGVATIPLEGPVVGRRVSAATRVGNARSPATAAVLAALRRAGEDDAGG